MNQEKTFKTVSKEEFLKYLRDYPRTLERDVCGISEPPTITYNDFKLGSWPDSVVARYNDAEEKDKQYEIVVNFENGKQVE